MFLIDTIMHMHIEKFQFDDFSILQDHNSDTDSALSSAPPSISPQPPSSGADSGVMWQAVSILAAVQTHILNVILLQLQDLDKLQKEVEIYHKENQRLQTELQLIKQELVTAEKAALSASNNHTHINELLQRIKDLEEEQVQLNTEASELREQNELLEFRILELEDDKVNRNKVQVETHWFSAYYKEYHKSIYIINWEAQ